jgi:hypothetical protein
MMEGFYCKKRGMSVELVQQSSSFRCSETYCPDQECPFNHDNSINNIIANTRKEKERKQKLFITIAIAAVLLAAAVFLFFTITASPTSLSSDILAARLDDQDEDTRLKAALELARRKDSAALEPLVAITTSDSQKNRRMAAEALGLLGDPRAVPALIGLLVDPNIEVVETTSSALGLLGDPESLEPLLTALRDRPLKERWAVAAAFRKIQNERAIPYLVEAVDSDDVVTKHNEALADALANQGEAAFQPLIDSMLNGGNGAWILAEIEKKTHRKISRLHDAITNRDLEFLSRSYAFFFYLDQDDDLDGIDEQLTETEQEVLAASLLAYGDKDMAQTFANFRIDKIADSSILPDAANTWAEQHGYTLIIKNR